jgi:hypothetical protein
MSNSTFKAIEHKVNLALCFVVMVIAFALIFSTFATAKSMSDNNYSLLKNNMTIEFNDAKLAQEAQHKIAGGPKPTSSAHANAVKSNSSKSFKSNITSTMPVVDDLAPALKKTRLI